MREIQVRKLMLIFISVLTISAPVVAMVEELSSGEYFVTQSWSQEKEFKRPFYVSVPKVTDQPKLPVFIFLHGNGGNAKGSMNAFVKRNPAIAARYVLVVPDGYLKSWNIVSERSKADDRGFIEEIVKKLSAYHNVRKDNFTIMGSSNGAALVNQLAIECRLPNIRNYVTGVSPLNVFQHDGRNFKAKGDDNNYQEPSFVVILADDQGWNALSTRMDPGDPGSGSTYYQTPNLDRLVGQGMRFSQAYSPAPTCSPTRHAIQFGRSPASLKIFGADGIRDWDAGSDESLANVLKKIDSDYVCAHLGKWHIGRSPETLGYDVSDGSTGNGTGNSQDADDPKLIFDLSRRSNQFIK